MESRDEDPAPPPQRPPQHLFESSERLSAFERGLGRLLHRSRSGRHGLFYLFAGVGFFSIHSSEATGRVLKGLTEKVFPWMEGGRIAQRDLEEMFVGLLAWAVGHYMWSTSRRLAALHAEVTGHRAGPPPLPASRPGSDADA